jgi:hypothetical protein
VLHALKHLSGGEEDHMTADELLLRLIGDPEITAAFEALPKWYA